jgi:hypothetical protein
VQAWIRHKEDKSREARELLTEADGIVRAVRNRGVTAGPGDDWREWLRYDVLRGQVAEVVREVQR